MQSLNTFNKTALEILDEHNLVEQSKKDVQNFAVLYENYYESIFRFVYQRLEQKEDAFDITQQVFLKAMSHISTYQNKNLPFSAWLFRIALNELTDLFRSQKKQRTINIDSVQFQSMMEEVAEAKIDRYHDRILAIISDELNADEINLIEMRFFEKRSFTQIGNILSITENNAKVRTYRVLDKLKKRMIKVEETLEL